MKGELYVGATPLGHLGDLSARIGEVMASVDFLLCEDTRVTLKLAQKFNSRAKLLSLHQFNELNVVRKWGQLLEQGKKMLLVTDAGTPGISDPGFHLVEYALNCENVQVIPIPGPSSVTTALSVSGFDSRKFAFVGFMPRKESEIQSLLFEYAPLQVPVVFFESAKRLKQTMEILMKNMTHDTKIVICKELTKQYEFIKKDTLARVMNWIYSNPDKVKGEWTCVLGPYQSQKTRVEIPDIQSIADFFGISKWESEKIHRRLVRKSLDSV